MRPAQDLACDIMGCGDGPHLGCDDMCAVITARDAEWNELGNDLQIHGHGMGQEECASHHPEMIAVAKEEGRREAIALIAAENRAQAARAGCQGRCNRHNNACRVARPHEGRCVCGWSP